MGNKFITVGLIEKEMFLKSKIYWVTSNSNSINLSLCHSLILKEVKQVCPNKI